MWRYSQLSSQLIRKLWRWVFLQCTLCYSTELLAECRWTSWATLRLPQTQTQLRGISDTLHLPEVALDIFKPVWCLISSESGSWKPVGQSLQPVRYMAVYTTTSTRALLTNTWLPSPSRTHTHTHTPRTHTHTHTHTHTTTTTTTCTLSLSVLHRLLLSWCVFSLCLELIKQHDSWYIWLPTCFLVHT